jgi:16S rRNA (guanine966-N2)-methyltransferase
VGGGVMQFKSPVASRTENGSFFVQHNRSHRYFISQGGGAGFFQGASHGRGQGGGHDCLGACLLPKIKVLAFAHCTIYEIAMRIVGGKFRGRTLLGPDSIVTRPTSDRVRESIFNILSHGVADFEIEGQRVLDTFAGTGALGLEALSRGAKFCQFVEESSEARGVIRKNADAMGMTGLCKIWRRDAADLGSCAPQSPFGLVFCDPPYGKGLGQRALVSLVAGEWLAANAIVVLEESRQAAVPAVEALIQFDQREYGDTQAVFYRVKI